MPTKDPLPSEPSLLAQDSTPVAAGTPEEWPTVADVGTPHFLGDYQILKEVARGGMGVVFKARHSTSGIVVALKTIRMDRDVSEEAAQRFQREIQAAQQLQHPNVVRIHDVGHDGRRAYFTMDFIAGGNLARHRRRLQDDVRASVAVLAKVARGVAHAHEHGILHRDLKPGNILLDQNDEPMVGDFGLARFLDTAMDLTRTGQALGTPGYMAPEQALGQRQRVGRSTDIWSLGVILYEMLTGRRPFLAEDEAELLRQILQEPPPSPRLLRPDLDAALEAIILKCLEKDPADRYQSAGDLAEDLERWLKGQPISVRRPTWGMRLRRTVRRHPLIVAAVLLLAVSAACVPAYFVWRDSPLRHYEKQLAAGEAVELIGENGYPAWLRGKSAFTDPTVRPKLDSDGFFAIDSFETLGLFELMPDPQLERYRFRATVRQLYTSGQGMVGLYVNHVQISHEAIRHNFCNSLGFTEHELTPGSPPRSEKFLRFSLTHGCEAPENRDNVDNLPLLTDTLKDHGTLGQWRELALEVTPDSVSAFLNNEPKGKVERSRIDQRMDRLGKSENHEGKKRLPGLELPRYSPRQGIGLFVQRGGASFKSVVVEPLP